MKLWEFGQLFLMITVGLGGFMVSAAVFEYLATVIPVGLAMLVFFLLIALVVALFMVIYDWEPVTPIGKMVFPQQDDDTRRRVNNAILGNTPENLEWDAYA